MMNKEINLLRGFAICAVVGIHTFSIALNKITTGVGYFAYSIFHALLGYAVPCFIFMSSILLSYPLKGGKKLDIATFYKKKFMRVVVPYFIWTAIFMAFKIGIGERTLADLRSLENWKTWLLYGKTYTHLYYIVIVMQLYLFAPLLLGFIKGLQKISGKYDFWVVVILSTALQVCIYFINKFYIYQHFKHQATVLLWYIYLVFFGIWVGYNYERFKKGLLRYSPIVWLIYSFNAIIFAAYKICLIRNTPISTTWYQMNWYAYVLFSTLILLWLCCIKWQQDNTVYEEPIKIVDILGGYAFGIYLMHPIITYYLRQWVHTTHPFGIFIVLCIGYVVMMIACILIINLLRLFKLGRIMIGEK